MRADATNVSEEVELRVAGQAIAGWEEVEVSRSLEGAAATFSLKVSDKSGWPIPPRSPCELLLGGDVVITGFVEAIEIELTEEGHTVVVRGRDKTGDLVDCSAMNVPPQWYGKDLYQLAVDLCDPFSMAVVQEVDVGDPFFSFALQPGETVYEAIERTCRLRAVLPTSDELGRLVLTRARDSTKAGTAITPGRNALVDLVEGQNLLSMALKIDDSARYANYVVRGHQQGTDLVSSSVAAGPEGRASDEGARAGRTLLVIAEGALDDRKAQTRAEWEATVRAARSQPVTAAVTGWRQTPGGPLWRRNQVVVMQSPTLRIDGELLVVSTKMELNLRTGTTTELSLCRADGYRPDRIPTALDDLSSGLEEESENADGTEIGP